MCFLTRIIYLQNAGDDTKKVSKSEYLGFFREKY